MIKCPFCEHIYSDDDIYASANDLYAIAPNEECVSEVCPSCTQAFWIQGGYTPIYETRKSEEGDE